MATRTTTRTDLSTRTPQFGWFQKWMRNTVSFFKNLFSRKTKSITYDEYLLNAEHIRQQIKVQALQTKMNAHNGYN